MDKSIQDALEDRVAAYYSDKIEKHGISPQGVDWNSSDSQENRFLQFLKLVDMNREFVINDLGCGYGALYQFLKERNFGPFKYVGYDLSEKMIQAARSMHSEDNCKFVLGGAPSEADYTVASGIFNVRLETPDEIWEKYIFSSLDSLNSASSKGFAFNMLTSYSDKEKMRDYLYYANPCFFFDWCKQKYSREVALLHDYGLYEFTILVRK
ncbi:MAG: class I SAM-dependent methyltransferase [Candidatus Obscuribacterales bacterium]|jgi:SAM-dependent methyltransferase|nr:class I SAM-dependent methyltransferase [Candidatus Obscuribacterales bacterium]